MLARANRDLTIGKLKSGKEDHAFVLVGEPDIELIERPDGTCQAALQAYNVYDPGCGNVRLGGKPTDIDFWMIDTDYDVGGRTEGAVTCEDLFGAVSRCTRHETYWRR